MLRFTARLVDRAHQLSFFLILPLAILAWLGGALIASLTSRDGLAATVSALGGVTAIVSGVLSWMTYKLGRILDRAIRRARETSYSVSDSAAVDMLYLRPFDVDQRPAGVTHSFEEVLFAQYPGRVTAVSDPKPTARGVGGVRRVRLPAAAGSKTAWVAYVEGLISKARLIVMVCDWRAEGLRSEFHMIADGRAFGKTIYITSVTDHLGWALMLASLDDSRINEFWAAARYPRAVREDLLDCIKDETLRMSVLGDRVPAFERSPYKVESVGSDGAILPGELSGPCLQAFREAVEKARVIALRPEWGTRLVPCAVLLYQCGVPFECLAMIHSLMFEGTQGVTFGGGMRLWADKQAAEGRIRDRHATLFRIVWGLVRELSLMGSGREQLREAQKLSVLLSQMVNQVEEHRNPSTP